MTKPAKNTICLWYDRDAEEAARFYAKTFPDSSVKRVHKAPGDYPAGKKGDVLMVEFTVLDIPCLGLNGGPEFKHNEAFSFQVATADQAETDRHRRNRSGAPGLMKLRVGTDLGTALTLALSHRMVEGRSQGRSFS